MTSIGDYAFAYCESLSECTIPENVTSIGASAFARTGITSAVILEGVTDIGVAAFSNCTALESVTIPNSLVTLGRYAFESCSSLTEITIPKSVVTIGEHAFEACSGLTSVTIEDGVEIIDDSAFYNCKGITDFYFPASVRYIGKNALYGTSDGVTITILNPLCEIDNSSYTVPYNAKIVGYTNSTAKYLASKNNLQFESCGENPGEEPSNLTGLGDLNADDTVNASDAAQILIAAAAIGAGRDAGLTEAQKIAADVNSDETINASDAAIGLIYAAAAGAGQDVKLTDFVK